MNEKGREKIIKALHNRGIEATVTPELEEGEKWPYVSIQTDPSVSVANVLYALHQGELFKSNHVSIRPGEDHPELYLCSELPQSLGNLTFGDQVELRTGNW